MHKPVIAGALALALLTAACSTAQLNSLTAKLDNFDKAVERINSSIANVSPGLYQKCQSAQSVGTQLQPFAQKANRTAGDALTVVNSALRAGCQTAPTDIASAILALASAADAGYSAYLAVKAGS